MKYDVTPHGLPCMGIGVMRKAVLSQGALRIYHCGTMLPISWCLGWQGVHAELAAEYLAAQAAI